MKNPSGARMGFRAREQVSMQLADALRNGHAIGRDDTQKQKVLCHQISSSANLACDGKSRAVAAKVRLKRFLQLIRPRQAWVKRAGLAASILSMALLLFQLFSRPAHASDLVKPLMLIAFRAKQPDIPDWRTVVLGDKEYAIDDTAFRVIEHRWSHVFTGALGPISPLMEDMALVDKVEEGVNNIPVFVNFVQSYGAWFLVVPGLVGARYFLQSLERYNSRLKDKEMEEEIALTGRYVSASAEKGIELYGADDKKIAGFNSFTGFKSSEESVARKNKTYTERQIQEDLLAKEVAERAKKRNVSRLEKFAIRVGLATNATDTYWMAPEPPSNKEQADYDTDNIQAFSRMMK